MTVVAKLGSAIVADDAGELRSTVLDSVCEQVAELSRGGENVAMVTSGAIARGILRRLLDWRVVPVVNENDTTATDEITFGDNDFLSAQVAILLEARLL